MPVSKEKVAGRLALGALETMQRLVDMTEVRGMSLTDNQDEDLRSAVESWNSAAGVIGMPRITEATVGSVARAEKALDSAILRIKMDQDPEYESLRNLVDSFAARKDGRPSDAPRAADEIRSMIASGEREHDFDMLESEAIRSLPSLDDEETRAITNFDNGSSLYVNDFASWVAVYARTASPWLGLSTVVTSENGRPLVVPKLTGDPTVYTPGEGTAITPSDVTLTSVTVTPTGYKALMLVSAEAFEDEDVNLTKLIAGAQARAVALAFGSAATTAVLAGISNGGTATGVGGYGTATGAFFGYEDLVPLKYGRAAPYRTNGTWIMANGAIQKVAKFKDGQGNYLWANGELPIGGQVYEDPNLATPASATKSVIYGDPAAGLIVKQSPIRVAMSTDYKFNEDVVAIKTVHRIALAVQDPAALAYLVSANS